MGNKVKNRGGSRRVLHLLLAPNRSSCFEHFSEKAGDTCDYSVISQYIFPHPRLVQKMSLLTSHALVTESDRKFSVNHWMLMSCSLRIAQGWFIVFINFVVVHSLEWDSRSRA